MAVLGQSQDNLLSLADFCPDVSNEFNATQRVARLAYVASESFMDDKILFS